MTSNRLRYVGIVLAALALALPLGVLVWARHSADASLERIDPTEPPVTDFPVVTTANDRRAVSIEVDWEEPYTMVAPAWSGTVTGRSSGIGSDITTGTEVVEIDRVRRLAVQMDRPFHRPLVRGDTGSDVEQLQVVLGVLGYTSGDVPGVYGRGTHLAVQSLARDLGAPTDVGFDPGWLVLLQEPSVTLTEVNLQVGAPAPPQGTPIASGPRRVRTVVAKVDGEAVDLSGEWVLGLGGADVPLHDGVPTDREHPAFQRLPTGSDPVAGEIRRPVEREVVTLPAAAIAVGVDGHTCVWVRGDDRQNFEALTVTVRPGPSSTVVEVIDGPLDEAEILVNHATQLEASTCPSR